MPLVFGYPPELQPPDWSECKHIGQALRLWVQQSIRPIVLFIDEIDALQNDVLISVLRQLRDGYPRRPQGFPQALALIGLRDIRDYKVVAEDRDRLGTASPFNIKVESVMLQNFSPNDVVSLYAQHSTETGQAFTPDAIQQVYDLTQGQPWLVNALARQLVETIVPDRAIPITLDHVNLAKEILIRRQDTHLDSLAKRLTEKRVKAIIQPMIIGQSLAVISNDDREYLIDLGLIKQDPTGSVTIANPIYRELFPRLLAQGLQDNLPRILARPGSTQMTP
jgi:hypothetical protein